LNRVLAPEGEILSFARPKESIQRKSRPMPLASCALPFLLRVAKWGSCPIGNARHPCRAPAGYSQQKRQLLGAAYGIENL